MSSDQVKKIDDMEAVYQGAFKRARAELGVEAFGMQVIDLPPDYENYPEHDHTHDNQEEVFIALRGSGEIEIGGERFPFDGDCIARVGPETKRKVWPGSEGIRMIVLGGVPGEAYQASEISKLGAPDPAAAS
jgi:mannose-6-phosphate isomerase-like protein (cupin superfamily)